VPGPLDLRQAVLARALIAAVAAGGQGGTFMSALLKLRPAVVVKRTGKHIMPPHYSDAQLLRCRLEIGF
jgi:hypothetical protein